MPKIISANLNGIRSAAKKGFFDWMGTQSADFICVQELKCQASDMTDQFRNPHGYHGHFHYAEKKGYSGTGVYSKIAPDAVKIGFGSPEFDAEGRYVRCDFGDLTVISVYCPSGSSSPERRSPGNASAAHWRCCSPARSRAAACSGSRMARGTRTAVCPACRTAWPWR